ncbi:MAG: alpha/beta hydrolase [Clostridia bacterium]|nr:alpha/beta hydrolase [Clostridia bacterium]
MSGCHEEYVRISDDKKTACLMVHGITGSPRYFDNIIPHLPKEWSIYNILLDGHGKKVCDFSKTSMKKWKAQVDMMLEMLSDEYEEIVIFAHSMGTLLCMDTGERYMDRIKYMVLFAVPLCPRLKFKAMYTSLKVILKMVDEENEFETNAGEQYSIEPDWRLWRYVGFAPRYIELLALCRSVRAKVCDVMIPSSVFMCGKDEMVGRKSWDYLVENPCFAVYCLDKSSHIQFDEDDFNYALAEIKNRITKKS